MALEANLTLGRFRLIAPLGAGGMGEVWRARDERLGRDVAIKVLPADVAADPDRLARFEREARALAALSHPNILGIHDFGREGEVTYAVTELLEGETLRERLRRERLPWRKAVEIAAAIADGLAAAHGKGIVHRDLKPENVFITLEGRPKILDFGLARLEAHALQDLDTLTSPPPGTSAGAVLGTVGYMAPEQVRGQPADARSDIFSFGCVLYEMLTRQRAFARDTAAETMTAILKEPAPEVSASGIEVSPELNRIVAHCLEKRPDERFQSASDIAFDLRALASAPTGPPRQLPLVGPLRPGWRPIVLAGVGLGALILGIVVATIAQRLAGPRTDHSTPQIVRSLLDVAPAEEVNAGGTANAWLPTPGGSRTALAWTPDGRGLVFVGRRGGVQQLYVRELAAGEARPLAGTEGAQAPVVSADGQWVAYWADGAIRKVSLAGGPISVLASDVTFPPAGMAWGASGVLLFAAGSPLVISKAAGGHATPATPLELGAYKHVLPQWLPGEAAFLYTARKRDFTWGGDEIVVQNAATGARRVVLRDAVDARYAAGHLVYMRMGTLFAVPFDLPTLEVRGEPVALVADVAQAVTAGSTRDATGAGQFAVAPAGSLAYIRRPIVPYPDAKLVTVDRSGRVTPLAAPARGYGGAVRVSPDGSRLATLVRSTSEQSLWMYDLRRGVLTKLPGQGEVWWVSWMPDGRRLVFAVLEDGTPRVAWQPADGSAPPEHLTDSLSPASWSPDARELVGTKSGDVWALNLEDDGRTVLRPVVQSPARDVAPALSPDGRWLAYQSDASGRWEVYVQPYPGPGPRVQVSVDGGFNPAWHPNGQELYFLALAGSADTEQMLAVEISPGATLGVGQPRSLFQYGADLQFWCIPLRCYDVAPDGEHFYVTQQIPPPPTPPVTHIHLVLNWLDEVKARLAGSAPN